MATGTHYGTNTLPGLVRDSVGYIVTRALGEVGRAGVPIWFRFGSDLVLLNGFMV